PTRRIARDFCRIELAECAAVAVAFLEHDRPAQTCLCRFDTEQFKIGTVIVGWHTPLPIVIVAHQLIVAVDPGPPFRLRTRHVVALTAWLAPVRESLASSYPFSTVTLDNQFERSLVDGRQ